MTSHSPSAFGQHGHDSASHHFNVYTRPAGFMEADLNGSSSTRKNDHAFMENFRERLNFRGHREGVHSASCDNEILDEALGYPPTRRDAPPDDFGNGVTSDSHFFNPTFRSRSRSDATTPISPRQSKGYIVLFPNTAEKRGRGRSTRVRSERHSVCVTDLTEMQRPVTFGCAPHNSNLYVDTNLANEAVSNDRKQGHSAAASDPVARTIWSSMTCLTSPLEFRASGGQGDVEYYEGGYECDAPRTSNAQRTKESEPASPYSKYALVIKESQFSPSAEMLTYPLPVDSTAPEFFKIIFESQEAVYSSFMRAHKCYDLIPTSTKVLVFDTELSVKKAFYALVFNGMRAAPLWDSSKQEFVGMLTITDFIRILHKYHKSNDSKSDGIKGLEEHKISTWREELQRDGHLKPFVSISPSESLYRAVDMLCSEKVHRLPVIEDGPGNIAFILTHKRLIKFLFLYMVDLPRPTFMDKTPRELGIGTWSDVACITQNTALIDVMDIFLTKRVSALPVLDGGGKVTDIYAKFDAINLAADKSYDNLGITAEQALRHRAEWFEGVRCCSENDSLFKIVEMLVKAEVHRLVVVNNECKAVGVISLSDILRFLILEPPISHHTGESPDTTMDDSADSAGEETE